jgi:hypothetical protein
MARRWWTKISAGAKKVFHASEAAAKRAGQAAANDVGHAVHIGWDDTKKVVKKTARRFRGNPLGEVWKLTVKGPNGVSGYSYSSNKRELDEAARIWRAKGFRVTHTVRLSGPAADSEATWFGRQMAEKERRNLR